MQDEFSSEIDETNDQAKPPQLLQNELRVLGVLMEKQLTTPDQYPMTVNSIVTGCNQKTSRDPVTNYHQGEVLRALNELENRTFIRKEYGSRADKYSQLFISQLQLGKKQQALLCIMMLRGPQTLNELFTRTQRMNVFSDKEELNHCVSRLCEREIPYAIHLGTPGQRGERVAHLFSGTPTVETQSSSTAAADKRAPLSDEDGSAISMLGLEVTSLRDTVRKLELENVKIRYQLESLYKLTGIEIPDDPTDEHQTH